MVKTILSLAAAGMLVSAGAMAQNATKTEPAQGDAASTQAESGTAATGQHGATTGLRQEMKDSLQQAGFSNVRVIPDSFLVQAKDKDGHPVAMIINPHSMTEVVDEGTAGQGGQGGGDMASAGNGSGAIGQQGAGQQGVDQQGGGQQSGGQQGGTFTTVPKQEKLSSNIVGLSVYNDQNQDIGTIKDIAYANRHVQAYIVGVGGFLGMGDHYVAVQPGAVTIKWDNTSNNWRASVDATAQQLKAAPAYTYPNEG